MPYKSPHTLRKRAPISFDVPAFGPSPDDPSQLAFFKIETWEGKEDEIRDFFAGSQAMAYEAAQNIDDPGSVSLLEKLFSFGKQSAAVNAIAQRSKIIIFPKSIPCRSSISLDLYTERLNTAATLQNGFIVCESDNKGQGEFYDFMGSFPAECDKSPAPLAASYSLSHGYFASQIDKSPADQTTLEQIFGGIYMILCDKGFGLEALDAVTERFNIDTEQQEKDGIEPRELPQDGLCDYGNNQVSNTLPELMHLSSFGLGSSDVQDMSLAWWGNWLLSHLSPRITADIMSGHGPNLIDDLARSTRDCFSLAKGQKDNDPALNAESYALYGLAKSSPFKNFDLSADGEKAGR